jgi:hypothetical protein
LSKREQSSFSAIGNMETPLVPPPVAAGRPHARDGAQRDRPRNGDPFHAPPPQVERLVTFFSGGRYVFFSVAATIVALAATYQSVLHPPLPVEAVVSGDQGANPDALVATASDAGELGLWARFVKELLESRLSSTVQRFISCLLAWDISP